MARITNRLPYKEGPQKAIAAGVPNTTSAVLVLVYASTAYFDVGVMPHGVEIQVAIGLLVLAGFNVALTYAMPNVKHWFGETETPPTEEDTRL